MEKGDRLFRTQIQRMMIIHGELATPLLDTVDFVETIAQDQTIEIIRRASDIADLRSSPFINPIDIIFVVRHNKLKVSRIQRFLNWKEIRKTAENNEDDLEMSDNPDSTPVGEDELILPGYMIPFLDEVAIKPSTDPAPSQAAHHLRLAEADVRPLDMSEEEYLKWSDCRKASAVQGRKKRFRDWLGLERVTELKLHDDIFDILGLLVFDAVENLTKEALKVKQLELRAQGTFQLTGGSPEDGHDVFKTPFTLRSPPDPIQVRHVRGALDRLRVNPRQQVANLLGNRSVAPKLPQALI